MDTIHHLLRLNVEIEGALRVLANRDNEIALRILDEKTNEFSKIVEHLIKQEKINTSTNQTTKAQVAPKDICNKVIESFSHAVYELPTPDHSQVSEAMSISKEEDTSKNPSILSTEDPNKSETNAESKIEDIRSESSVAGYPLPEFTATDSDFRQAGDNRIVVNRRENDAGQESKLVESSQLHTLTNKKTPNDFPSSDSVKEKIRIDEMLSRREARDLSKAFTINDRFRFQLHIFDGDKESFNNTIKVISTLSDYKNAITYLSGILDIDTDDQDMVDFLAIIQNHFVE